MSTHQFKEMELIATKQVFSYTGITASATTNTIAFHVPGKNGYWIAMYARVTTAFTGVTAPTVKLGTSDDTEMYIQKQPIGTAGNLHMGARMYQGFCDALEVGGGSVYDHPLQIVFESTSGNLSSLSAGELEIVTVYAKEK